MKAAELREKSTGELRELEKDLREQLFKFKMQLYTGQLERVSELKTTKRDIARVLTVLSERAAAEA
jgi:large subunit ribosomal protein L29